MKLFELKWSEVKCSVLKEVKRFFMEKVDMSNEVLRIEGLGASVNTICVEKNTRKYVEYILTFVLFNFSTFSILKVLCVLLSY